jgi:hypothetical protein
MSDGTIAMTLRTVAPVSIGANTAAIWFDTKNMLNITNALGGSSTLLGTSACPVTYNSSGSAGQIAFSGSYIYICYAPDSWGRVGLPSW